MLQPALPLLDDRLFEPHDGRALAVFLRPGMARAFRVAVAMDPLVVVDDILHLTSLVAALAATPYFYVLARSLNETRLLRGTRDDIAEVAVRYPGEFA